jgi:predicted ATPase
MLGLLAEAYGRAGSTAEADVLLHEALAHVEQTQSRAGEAELHRLQGQLRLGFPGGDLAEAEAFFQRALGVARRQEARWWELRAATSLARVWAAGGEHRKARDLLAPVFDWFTEGTGMPDLAEAKELL